RIAASTARTWRRRDSDSVHSQKRVQASSRERVEDMAVTLAAGPPALMEKFVIEGGAQLSGTVVPAGNKNGALPLIAASLLTEEEVVLSNVPRIADVEAIIDLIAELGARVEWRGDNQVALCCVAADGAN